MIFGLFGGEKKRIAEMVAAARAGDTAGLGPIPGRRHHGHHHPGPPHAPLRDAGVRGPELPAQGGRRTHRHQPRDVIIQLSCLEQFDRP
jgi:hypothetical protein